MGWLWWVVIAVAIIVVKNLIDLIKKGMTPKKARMLE